MSGTWRSNIEISLHAPIGFSTWVHFVLFAGIARVAQSAPMCWSRLRVVGAALLLALLTEGLQFFAISRHPSWRDIVIDRSGTLVGLALVMLQTKMAKAKVLHDE